MAHKKRSVFLSLRLYNHSRKNPQNFRRIVRKLNFSLSTSTLKKFEHFEIFFFQLFIHENSTFSPLVSRSMFQRKAKIYLVSSCSRTWNIYAINTWESARKMQEFPHQSALFTTMEFSNWNQHHQDESEKQIFFMF